jgi:hypothetical protein
MTFLFSILLVLRVVFAESIFFFSYVKVFRMLSKLLIFGFGCISGLLMTIGLAYISKLRR